MDNCVTMYPECPKGWGLLGRQPQNKEQVGFSGLDYCVCGRCGSLKGHVPRPYRAQSHSPGNSRTVMCPLVASRRPVLLKNDICSFCFPGNALQRGQISTAGVCSAGPLLRGWSFLEMDVWRLARGFGSRKSAQGGSQLLLSKASSSLLHFVLLRAEPTFFHPPHPIQTPKLPLFPAISF